MKIKTLILASCLSFSMNSFATNVEKQDEKIKSLCSEISPRSDLELKNFCSQFNDDEGHSQQQSSYKKYAITSSVSLLTTVSGVALGGYLGSFPGRNDEFAAIVTVPVGMLIGAAIGGVAGSVVGAPLGLRIADSL